ncbi:MAG TPA: hypothetical protein VKE22_09680 [Haliangiales bacterium]|nr:hypothetical protein [Haliangiales bacterium]
MSWESERLAFLDHHLPRDFEMRVVTLAPGCRDVLDDGEWQDALLVVEQGDIDLERDHAPRVRLHGGAVLWLWGLGLRALHNPGPVPTVLVAVQRRRKHL